MEANQVSCLKLVWRILSSKTSLWIKWVNRYLIRKGSFCRVKESSTLGSWMWKKLLKCRTAAASFSKVEVHDGSSTSFWFNDWSALGRLLEKAGAEGVMNMVIRLHDSVATVIHKHRARRHRVDFYNLIEHEIQSLRNRGLHQEEDVTLWKSREDFKPIFTTKETWKLSRVMQAQVDWAQGVWFHYNTPKFSFHTWIAIQNRLPTGDRTSLWHGGTTVACNLCMANPESCNHLFFQCQYSEEVWKNLTQKLLSSEYTHDWDAIVPLLTKQRSKVELFLLRYVFQASLFAIWKERNGRKFGEDHKTAAGLIKLIDRQIRNRKTSINRRDNSAYQKAMTTWFSFR